MRIPGQRDAEPGRKAKKNPAGQGFKAQIDATTIWAGVHARDGDGLR